MKPPPGDGSAMLPTANGWQAAWQRDLSHLCSRRRYLRSPADRGRRHLCVRKLRADPLALARMRHPAGETRTGGPGINECPRLPKRDYLCAAFWFGVVAVGLGPEVHRLPRCTNSRTASAVAFIFVAPDATAPFVRAASCSNGATAACCFH